MNTNVDELQRSFTSFARFFLSHYPVVAGVKMASVVFPFSYDQSLFFSPIVSQKQNHEKLILGTVR